MRASGSFEGASGAGLIANRTVDDAWARRGSRREHLADERCDVSARKERAAHRGRRARPRLEELGEWRLAPSSTDVTSPARWIRWVRPRSSTSSRVPLALRYSEPRRSPASSREVVGELHAFTTKSLVRGPTIRRRRAAVTSDATDCMHSAHTRPHARVPSRPLARGSAPQARTPTATDRALDRSRPAARASREARSRTAAPPRSPRPPT